MQAIELMLGDWVFYPKTQEYCKVTTIHNKYLYCFPKGSDEKHSYGLREESICPVPLTKEILEKNGFVKYKTQYDKDFYEFWSEDSDRCIYLYAYDEYFLVFANFNMVINYVHQLQHAMRLCGIKKTIEL